MKDIDYDALDPGIRETVRMLRSWGFNTTDSGDGITKGEDGLSHPHVFIVCDPPEMLAQADSLSYRLTSLGIAVGQVGEDISIQATYDPITGTAIIMLCGVIVR